MQKILVVSDLHCEFGEQVIDLPERSSYDLVVVPGDISSCPVRSIDWAERTFDCPVVMVAGTREYFGRNRRRTIDEARKRAASAPSVHFLEDDLVVVNGIRFVGATLWTDFRLLGREFESFGRDICESSVLDYQFIWGDRRGKAPFTTGHAQAIHFESLAFIRDTLSQSFDGPSVVVSHHAPHRQSAFGRDRGDFSVTSTASDLEADILRLRPTAWIHGCVHGSLDYEVGETRIVCNGRGIVVPYGSKAFENRDFDVSKVLAL